MRYRVQWKNEEGDRLYVGYRTGWTFDWRQAGHMRQEEAKDQAQKLSPVLSVLERETLEVVRLEYVVRRLWGASYDYLVTPTSPWRMTLVSERARLFTREEALETARNVGSPWEAFRLEEPSPPKSWLPSKAELLKEEMQKGLRGKVRPRPADASHVRAWYSPLLGWEEYKRRITLLDLAAGAPQRWHLRTRLGARPAAFRWIPRPPGAARPVCPIGDSTYTASAETAPRSPSDRVPIARTPPSASLRPWSPSP